MIDSLCLECRQATKGQSARGPPNLKRCPFCRDVASGGTQEQASFVYEHVTEQHQDELRLTGSVETARRIHNLSCTGVRVMSSAERLRQHLRSVEGLTPDPAHGGAAAG